MMMGVEGYAGERERETDEMCQRIRRKRTRTGGRSGKGLESFKRILALLLHLETRRRSGELILYHRAQNICTGILQCQHHI